MSFEIPTKKSIENAHNLIKKHIVETPVLQSDYFNDLLGLNAFFKCENLQKIGAFKARGALNATLNIDESQIKNGICTHSSGNHAQAIAFAAKLLGIKAKIVMPNNAPLIKKDGVKRLGATIIECEPNIEARQAGVDRLMQEEEMNFIHPFDNDKVVCGQATVAKEFLEQVKDLDAIFAPLGGGGLLSGTSLSAKYFGNDVKVYGVEPEGAADGILSFKSGKVEKAPYIKTIADGLLTPLSENTLSIISQNVSEIFTVSDEEIIEAMKLVFQFLKVVIEPSSATVVAALIKNKSQFKGQNVGLIFSGGNVDLNFLTNLA